MKMDDIARTLSVLLIGLGSIGARHARNLRTLGCRDIGALRVRGNPIQIDLDMSGICIYDNLENALLRGYDVVMITNPTSLHLNYAVPSARSGVHLYVEKPISNSLEGVQELQRYLKKSGKKAMVGYQLRFHPNMIAIKKWIENGSVGQILYVYAENGEFLPDWHPWEDYRGGYAARRDLGGGVVLTQIHEIDYLFWLFGNLRVKSAWGGGSGVLELNVEDHISCVLENEINVPIFLHMDYLQRPPVRILKIVGSDGAIFWNYHTGTATLTKSREKIQISRVPESWTRNDMFLDILKQFIFAIRKNDQPAIPIEDGVASLRIALEIKEMME